MKQIYQDAFSHQIEGDQIAAVNGNTIALFNGLRCVCHSETADEIRADIAADPNHPYAELAKRFLAQASARACN